MTHAPLTFNKRIRRISRRHNRMASGMDAYVASDGLIVTRPKRRGIMGSLPIKGLALLLIGFVGFKGLLLAHLGAESYDQRVALLQEGTAFEQAGAWFMQADPVTQWAAAEIGPVLRNVRVAVR